jgi:hypothetical protein
MEQIDRLRRLCLAEEELDCICALILEGIVKPESFKYFTSDDSLQEVLRKYLSKCMSYVS